MIDNVKLTNLYLLKTIEFGRDESFGLLLEDDNGIVISGAQVSSESYDRSDKIGKNVISKKLEPRQISLTGFVWSKDFNDEALQINQINELKKELSTIINPMHNVRLEIGEFFIDGVPDMSVEFSSSWYENNEIKCKFTFSLTCYYPLFKKNLITATALSGSEPMLVFPMTITKKGTVFGKITRNKTVIVSNNGDVTCGGEINIKVGSNSVKNLKIINVLTGEYILINKTLSSGEEITINTVEKTIEGVLDGESLKYYKYWDSKNKWLMFDVGDNYISYSMDTTSNVELSIDVSLIECFYNVEGQ